MATLEVLDGAQKGKVFRLDREEMIVGRLPYCDVPLAERNISRQHARVVKTLNTVTAAVMVQPQSLAEPTTTFLAGDDEAAKAFVADLLVAFGWDRAQVVDLGDHVPRALVRNPLEPLVALHLQAPRVAGQPAGEIEGLPGIGRRQERSGRHG